ncbi:hypothetical protein QUF61_09125 [Candidatus Venteria ishoeyi]|uniref:hypothetical protein n=1 Tax=Candidatus Venteria ishoeyi TaxID=1899563 RepID=UPI0025A60F26|nr:hypothetical protein [Candidatus Venteria ishoeyi]MDM8546639.1 hypothetical protein [Candidatus Venteria ishoeyi]
MSLSPVKIRYLIFFIAIIACLGVLFFTGLIEFPFQDSKPITVVKETTQKIKNKIPFIKKKKKPEPKPEKLPNSNFQLNALDTQLNDFQNKIQVQAQLYQIIRLQNKQLLRQYDGQHKNNKTRYYQPACNHGNPNESCQKRRKNQVLKLVAELIKFSKVVSDLSHKRTTITTTLKEAEQILNNMRKQIQQQQAQVEQRQQQYEKNLNLDHVLAENYDTYQQHVKNAMITEMNEQFQRWTEFDERLGYLQNNLYTYQQQQEMLLNLISTFAPIFQEAANSAALSQQTRLSPETSILLTDMEQLFQDFDAQLGLLTGLPGAVKP